MVDTIADTIQARVTHKSPAAPEQIYDAWLDPDQIRRWMTASLKQIGLPGEMIACGTDPVVGGAFLFSDRRNGAEQRHWGHYRHLERPAKIVFTWLTSEAEAGDPSKITILIAPDPDSTGAVVTLCHEMLARWEPYREGTEGGWRTMLEQIDMALTGY